MRELLGPDRHRKKDPSTLQINSSLTRNQVQPPDFLSRGDTVAKRLTCPGIFWQRGQIVGNELVELFRRAAVFGLIQGHCGDQLRGARRPYLIQSGPLEPCSDP